MLREGRDIDNIDIEASHEPGAFQPIRGQGVTSPTTQRTGKRKGGHPCSRRVATVDYHQNISA